MIKNYKATLLVLLLSLGVGAILTLVLNYTSDNMFGNKNKFVLPKLPYAYNALEPYIDAQTMEIHHNKHHQAYVDNLNDALKDHPELQKKSLDYLLKNLDSIPEDIREKVRNNGGGHYNHSLFWLVMAPKPEALKGDLKEAINKYFGSFENFKDKFNNQAKTRFGSGWAWLVMDKNGGLSVISTPNQDSPISQDLIPILTLDVWEHAYYLKYQNKRPDYISAWWSVVNWPQVEKNYQDALDQIKTR